MTQREICEYLKRNNTKWYTVQQLVLLTNMSNNQLTVGMKKLRHYKLVEFRRRPEGHHNYEYKHKEIPKTI